jgi:hypothetical protein
MEFSVRQDNDKVVITIQKEKREMSNVVSKWGITELSYNAEKRSSWIQSIEYSISDRTLLLLTKKGTFLRYTGVPKNDFACLIEAESIGSEFSRLRKNWTYE